MKNFIKLEDCRHSNNRIIYKFNSDLRVFQTNTLFIEYSSDLPPKIDSIASLPFIALMAPLGWLSGADIIVEQTDETYFESLVCIEKIYKQWYPAWKFTNQLKTKLMPNSFTTSRQGLLFSLGLDSLTSFTTHADKNPFLFTVLGLETSVTSKNYLKEFEQKTEDFKKSFNIEGIFIHTNISHIINEKKLKWWAGIAHGLCLTALTAPYSYNFLKTLYIASSFSSLAPERGSRWGSTKNTDNLISWASTQVSHDNHEFERYQKIKYQLKPHPEIYPYLRVCLSQSQTLNCTECEKCLRTVLGLLINNIDPLECNFHITNKTLKYLKRRLKYDIFCVDPDEQRLWMHIKNNMDAASLKDIHQSTEFFHWFKNFSFKENLIIRIFLRLSWLFTYRYNENKFMDILHTWAKHSYRFYTHTILKIDL